MSKPELLLLALAFAGCTLASPGPAPPFSLVTTEGAAVTLASFAGRPLLLDMMSVTCGPCILSMPHYRAFAAAHPEVSILSVDVDRSDDASDLAGFRAKYNASWPFALDTDRVAEKYGATGIPSLFVIDGDGRIVETHTLEAVTLDDLERLSASVRADA